MDVLGCANPGAVNTFCSHSSFIWLFVLGLLLSSSHSLAGFITVLCNRVYLANSRNSPLSHYCLMAADVAFLKGRRAKSCPVTHCWNTTARDLCHCNNL